MIEIIYKVNLIHVFIQWTYWVIIKSSLQLWYWYCLHTKDIENPDLLFCNLSYIILVGEVFPDLITLIELCNH